MLSSAAWSDVNDWDREFCAREAGVVTPELAREEPVRATWAHSDNRIVEGTHMLDAWSLDDGTIVAHPMLAAPLLDVFDGHSDAVGAERNHKQKQSGYVVLRVAGRRECRSLANC